MSFQNFGPTISFTRDSHFVRPCGDIYRYLAISQSGNSWCTSLFMQSVLE